MFLKKKWCGTIKGHGCVDEWKQRAYITKEESTSPTISTEAVFLTAIVNPWENHKVAVLDVPGVEKLQFSLFSISCSQGILSSSYSPGIFPKDCLFTYIFHSL